MSASWTTARARLAGPVCIAALVAAAAGGLVALQLDARAWLRGRGEPDGVALAYLRARVARHPRDAALRIRLAREELALGRIADAERTLAPLRGAASPEAREAERLALDVAMAAWRAAPAGTPERAAVESTARSHLGALAERSDDPSDLTRLAVLARETGSRELAARSCERAAALSPARCAELLAVAARDLLSAGDPGRAAELSARAYGCASAPGDARALGLAALDAYLAADRGAQALPFAEALARRFSSDRPVLERAEQIALAQSDRARARSFGARLVELGAVDAARLRRQVALSLGAGELDDAVLAAGRLVTLAPHDEGARFAAARVAAWAGQRELALRHWRWLARRGAPGSVEEALALARGLGDDAAIAEILLLESGARPLSSAALSELAIALERLGAPGRAVAALERHADRHPASRDAWEALVAFHERRGDPAAALAVRDRIARRFGPSAGGALAAARLHRALGDPRAGLAELLPWAGSAEAASAEGWALLGDLAWSAGSDEVASRAYRTLWESGRIDALGTERLFLLDRRAGRTDDAIRVGREGWRRVEEPRFLLLAMDEAARAERWGELARLAAEAERSEAAFAGFAAYWMLRARLDEKAGRPARAAARYRRALAVDPGSPAARSGLLWLLAATGDRDALARQLAAWRPEAEREPGLWRAYAAGLEALGRTREALTFHERVVRADPRDATARQRLDAALRAREDRPLVTVAAEGGAESFGPLRLQRLASSARAQLLGTGVELRAGVTRFTSRADVLPRGVETRVLEARAARPVLGGWTELSAGVELRGAGALARGALAHARDLAGPFEVRLDGAFNEPAAESAALLVEGLRHRLGAALAASAGAVYGRAAAGLRRWATREGTWLADGAWGTAELGVRTRAADPGIRVRLVAEHQRAEVAVAPPLSALAQGGPILPAELSMVGVGTAISRWRIGPVHLSTDAWLGWMTPPLRPAYRVQAALAVAPRRRTELSLAGFAANDRWDLGHGGLGLTLSFAHHFPQ